MQIKTSEIEVVEDPRQGEQIISEDTKFYKLTQQIAKTSPTLTQDDENSLTAKAK